MSNDIVIGAGMRANLLSLQKTNSLLDATQFKLSTGKKVNSALDGASAFFSAQSLSNRAKDLGRLLDGMGQSIQTIKQADKGITAMTKLVEQAEAIATDARDAINAGAAKAVVSGNANIRDAANLAALGISDGDDLNIKVGSAAAVEVNLTSTWTAQELVTQINDTTGLKGKIEASLNSAGQLEIRALNDGDLLRIGGGTTPLTQTEYDKLGLGDVVRGTTAVSGTVISGRTIESKAVVGAKAEDLLNGKFGTVTAGTFTLTVDGTAGTAITLSGTTTIQGLVDAINSDSKTNGKVTAAFDEDTGKISLQATSATSKVQIDFSAAQTGYSFGFGAGAADVTASNAGQELISFSGSGNLSQLEKDFKEVKRQIDALTQDANYRGVNLLRGDSLTTMFNEDSTNTLVTQGVDFTSKGLGLIANSLSSLSTSNAAINQAKSALESVRAFGTTIANSLSIVQMREDFTKETIETLNAGADKLTLADMNEEGAKMLALQTRLQLGVTSLSLASQSSQSVLSLF